MKTMARLRDLVEYLDRIGMENTSRELSDLMDTVKAQRRESIPRAAYERKKAGWLAHIRECETALAKRNLRIRELEKELEGTLRRTAELECTCRMQFDDRECRYRCSRCGCLGETYRSTDGKWYAPEYCSSCGAKAVSE